MRLRAIGLLVLAGCSSSEVTTTITSSSGSAPKPATSAAKSAAASVSASTAPATSSAPAAAMRDADAELKAIDPFGEGGDGAQKLVSATALCGEPSSGDAPWGKEVPADKPPASRCKAEDHAKLYMKSVSWLADGKGADKKLAEEHAFLALALDPKAELPADAKAGAKAAVEAAKKRGAPEVRLGAVTTSDEATKKELETAIAGELTSAVRFCYAHAVFTNKALEGSIAVEAEVAADGRLSQAKASGSLPDSGVFACVVQFANRSKVNAPSKMPTRVNIPFALTPSGK